MVLDIPDTTLTGLFQAIGTAAIVSLSLAAFVSLAVTAYLMVRGQGVACLGAMLLIAPLPFLVGLFLGGERLLGHNFGIPASHQVAPHPEHIVAVVMVALAIVSSGLLLSIPCYILALVGAVVRWQKGRDNQARE